MCERLQVSVVAVAAYGIWPLFIKGSVMEVIPRCNGYIRCLLFVLVLLMNFR